MKNYKNRATYLMSGCIMALLFLVACLDSGNDDDDDQTSQSSQNIQLPEVIGELNGTFGKALWESMQESNSLGSITAQTLLIDGDSLLTADATARQNIMDSHQTGKALVLLDASENHIHQLQELLGRPTRFSMIPDYPNVDAFALHLSDQVDQIWAIYPLQIGDPHPPSQQSRIDDLVSWLQEPAAQGRDNLRHLNVRQFSQQLASTNIADLTVAISQAFTFTQGPNSASSANSYKVYLNSYPIYSEDKESYFMLMSLSGDLSFQNQFSRSGNGAPGAVIYNYASSMSFEVEPPSGVNLLTDPSSQPATTGSAISLSNPFNLSYSVDGGVNYVDKSLKSASTFGGISWDWASSSSAVTSDIKVTNNSSTSTGTPLWDYTFESPPKLTGCEYSSPTKSASDSANPQMAWVWEIPKSQITLGATSISTTVKFNSTLSTAMASSAEGSSDCTSNVSTSPMMKSHQFSFPLPTSDLACSVSTSLDFDIQDQSAPFKLSVSFDGSASTSISVDTGSTGIAISHSNVVNAMSYGDYNNTTPKHVCACFELTSSGRWYAGEIVYSQLNISDQKGACIDTPPVQVLAVYQENQGSCPMDISTDQGCESLISIGVSGSVDVKNMGIAFDRPESINLVSSEYTNYPQMKDSAVSSSHVNQANPFTVFSNSLDISNPGFTVTSKSITTSAPSDDDSQYKSIQLDPSDRVNNDWGQPAIQFQIVTTTAGTVVYPFSISDSNDTWVDGTLLIDTGLQKSLVSITDSTIATTSIFSMGDTSSFLLPNHYYLQVRFPDETENAFQFISDNASESSSGTNPTEILMRSNLSPQVNTGVWGLSTASFGLNIKSGVYYFKSTSD